jgi:lincosamide nucleotidyltransferase A/C/D/E
MWRTRIADRANALVWRLPVPRRLRVLLSQLIYRNPPISVARVSTALQALEEAEVKTVLMGGWGVDALVGRQLRSHGDLDLLTEETDLDRAIETLKNLGYEPWNRDYDPAPIGNQSVSVVQTLRCPSLQVIELHATDLQEMRPAKGKLAGKHVACLTAEQQLQAQKMVERAWTPRRRLNRQRNLAAVQGALQRDPERV